MRMLLFQRPDGRPGLGLAGKDGKTRFALNEKADGAPGLALIDKDGKSRALLELHADGTSDRKFWQQVSANVSILEDTKGVGPP